MKWNVILPLLLIVFLIGFVSSNSLENLNYAQLDKEYTILQTCIDSTYINISVTNSEGIIIEQAEMIKNGSVWNYKFTPDTLGRHDVAYESDGCEKSGASFFIVTLNGKAPAEGIIVVVFSLIFIAIFGFSLIYFLKSLAHVIELNMDLIDCATMMAIYFSMWMFYYFSFEYLGNAFINNILEMAISIGAVTHVFMPLVGFLVSFIMTNLKFKQKARITY